MKNKNKTRRCNIKYKTISLADLLYGTGYEISRRSRRKKKRRIYITEYLYKRHTIRRARYIRLVDFDASLEAKKRETRI